MLRLKRPLHQGTQVSVATALVFDGDRLPQPFHLAATAEAFPHGFLPRRERRFSSSSSFPCWPAGLVWPAGWLALILEPRGRCTGCMSGANYDELQANAAVGVEDRRSIAARFSKAERSVDLICAGATCVPTLLLCIWFCPGSVKLPAIGGYRDLGQRPDDRWTSFGLGERLYHGSNGPKSPESSKTRPLIWRQASIQTSSCLRKPRASAQAGECEGPNSGQPQRSAASSRIAISSSCHLFGIVHHLSVSSLSSAKHRCERERTMHTLDLNDDLI